MTRQNLFQNANDLASKKSINVIYYMNRTKENIHLITADWEKPFNKISTHSWLKKKKENTQQTGIRRVFHHNPGGHLLKKSLGDAKTLEFRFTEEPIPPTNTL